jgi:hypothetical protein
MAMAHNFLAPAFLSQQFWHSAIDQLLEATGVCCPVKSNAIMVIDTHNLHSHAPPPLGPNSLPTPMDRTRSAHDILPVVLDQKSPIPQKHARGRRGSADAAMPRVLKHEPLYLESSLSTSSAAEAERSRMIAAPQILPVVLDQKHPIPQKHARGRRWSADAAMPRVLKHEPFFLESSFSTSSAAEAEHSLMIAAASEVRKQVILKGS